MLGFELGSEPGIVGRLGSGPHVGAEGYLLGGIFGRGLSPGGYLLESQS